MANACGDWGEGSHDRNEASKNYGHAAEACEKCIGALDVLDAEKAGLLAFEDLGPSLCPMR